MESCSSSTLIYNALSIGGAFRSFTMNARARMFLVFGQNIKCSQSQVNCVTSTGYCSRFMMKMAQVLGFLQNIKCSQSQVNCVTSTGYYSRFMMKMAQSFKQCRDTSIENLVTDSPNVRVGIAYTTLPKQKSKTKDVKQRADSRGKNMLTDSPIVRVGSAFTALPKPKPKTKDFKQCDGASYKKLVNNTPSMSTSALAVRRRQWPNIKDFKQLDGTGYRILLTETSSTSPSTLAVRPKEWSNLKDFKQLLGTSYPKMLTENPSMSTGSALAVRPTHWPNIKDFKLGAETASTAHSLFTPNMKGGRVIIFQLKQWSYTQLWVFLKNAFDLSSHFDCLPRPSRGHRLSTSMIQDFELWTATICNKIPKKRFEVIPVVIQLPDIQTTLGSLENVTNCPSYFDRALWTCLCNKFILLGYLQNVISLPSNFICALKTSQSHKLMLQDVTRWRDTSNKEMQTMMPSMRCGNALAVQSKQLRKIEILATTDQRSSNLSCAPSSIFDHTYLTLTPQISNDDQAKSKNKKGKRQIITIIIYLRSIHPVSENGNDGAGTAPTHV